jgi:hypothetical protein
MRRQEADMLKEKAENSPLWLLEMRVSRQNRLLMELKGQGTNAENSRWQNLVRKRNLYRKVLLKKLIEWDKGEVPDSNPSYTDYLEYTQDHKNRQETK